MATASSSNILLPRKKIILPRYDERAIFLGGTGSGKTFFAMKMASHYDKFVYIDTQNNLEPQAPYVTLSTTSDLQWNLAFRRDRHILFRPKQEAQTPGMFNQLLHKLHLRGKPKNRKTGLFDNPFVIYIDEAYHLGYGAAFPHWATKIAIGDRQKGVGLWTASQRPFNIPVPLRSECARYFVFYLAYEDDVKEVAKYGRPKKELERIIYDELKFDHSFVEIDRATASFVHRPAILQ